MYWLNSGPVTGPYLQTHTHETLMNPPGSLLMYVAPILPTEFLHGPPVFHVPHPTESLRPKPRTLNSQTLKPLNPTLPNAEASSPNPETMLVSIILIFFLYYLSIIPILSHYYSYIIPLFLYYPINIPMFFNSELSLEAMAKPGEPPMALLGRRFHGGR